MLYMYNRVFIILLKLRMKGGPTICDNMNEPARHYTEWNKPDTDRDFLHDLTHVKSTKGRITGKEQKDVMGMGNQNI